MCIFQQWHFIVSGFTQNEHATPLNWSDMLAPQKTRPCCSTLQVNTLNIIHSPQKQHSCKCSSQNYNFVVRQNICSRLVHLLCEGKMAYTTLAYYRHNTSRSLSWCIPQLIPIGSVPFIETFTKKIIPCWWWPRNIIFERTVSPAPIFTSICFKKTGETEDYIIEHSSPLLVMGKLFKVFRGCIPIKKRYVPFFGKASALLHVPAMFGQKNTRHIRTWSNPIRLTIGAKRMWI